MVKFLKGFFKVVGYIFLSILLFVVIININWSRQIRSEVNAIRAKNEPVSAADIDRWSIPNNQNGAVIYAKISKELSKPEVVADFRILRKFITTKGTERTPAMWKEARTIMARRRSLLPLIEQAANRPKCRFKVDHLSLMSKSPLDEYEFMRRIAHLLNTNALISAVDGNASEAVHSLSLALSVSKSLRDEPTIIPQLVRSAIVTITSMTLVQVVDEVKVSEAQAKSLADSLSSLDLNRSLKVGWIGERAVFYSLTQEFASGRSSIIEWLMDDPSMELPRGTRFLVRCYGLVMGRCEQLSFIRAMSKLVDGADVPYRQAPYRDDQETVPASTWKRLGVPPYAILTRILLPVHMRAGIHTFEAKTKADACGIILALHAYKDHFGAYPAGLDEVRTKLGWDVPKDPFSGRDFVYKRQGKGFVLYSVGPDLKDDGGKEPTKDDKDKGDIIWRMER